MRKRTNSLAGGEITKSSAEDRQFITALHRGLQVLRVFRPDDRIGLSNGDISERTGLPNSTVSRLTYTLLKSGYLLYNNETGRYSMGVPVLSLGYACLSGLSVRETAQIYMQELADHCGEGVLVALGGRVDNTMIYLATARSKGIISLQLGVGSRISLARSAMGRAYLAACDSEEREEILDNIRENVGPENWPALRDGINQAAHEIDKNGFYTNCGDWQPQVHSVAVPFKSSDADSPLLVFNLGGPSNYVPREILENELGPKLVNLVETLRKGKH